MIDSFFGYCSLSWQLSRFRTWSISVLPPGFSSFSWWFAVVSMGLPLYMWLNVSFLLLLVYFECPAYSLPYIEYEAGSWFSDFICLVSWLPHASDWHFFLSSRRFSPTVLRGRGCFLCLWKLNSPSSSSMPAIQSLGFSVRCFFLVVPAGTFFFTLSLSLFNWSIFFTFSSSSHSLPSAWVPRLMRLSTELVYLSFWIWKWFTPGISVSLLHSSLLSCATFLTSFHCVLGQQLLSVWIAFTNLDALCFLSTHVFDSFNHSFDFSGISPNSFSLDTISVGFIKWLEELRYLVFMCGFCYSSGTYTTAVSIFAWFTLLFMTRSQLTYLM